MNFELFKNEQLRSFLQALNLKSSGNKNELILRLQECDAVTLAKVMEKESQTPNSGKVVDVEQESSGKVDAVEQLRGDVSNLQKTVELLMAQLQQIVPGKIVPGNTSQQQQSVVNTVTAASSSLPLVESLLSLSPSEADLVGSTALPLVQEPQPPSLLANNDSFTAASSSLPIAKHVYAQSVLPSDNFAAASSSLPLADHVSRECRQSTSGRFVAASSSLPLANSVPPNPVPSYELFANASSSMPMVVGSSVGLVGQSVVSQGLTYACSNMPLVTASVGGNNSAFLRNHITESPSVRRYVPQIHAHSCADQQVASGYLPLYTSQSAYVPLTENAGMHLGSGFTRADVRDIIRIMPEFEPNNNKMTSVQFIERIDKLRCAYGWNEQLILYAVYDKLKGFAKSWIDAMPVFRTWVDFVRAFLIDFPTVVNSAEINMRMIRTRMGKCETTIDFYYKMLSIGRSGNLDDEAIITYIINGLVDENVRKTLSAIKFHSCPDLLKTLKNMSDNQMRAIISNHAASQAKVDYVEKCGSKDDKTGPVCFNCRERGHLSRNCDKPKKRLQCQKCGKLGHKEENCFSKKAIVNKIDLNEKPATTMSCDLVKDITINGASFNALIDSGSCKSLIKRNIALKIVEKFKICDFELEGFAGGKIHCKEKCVVNLCMDGEEFEVDLLVVEDKLLAHSVLVGNDILKRGCFVMENGECRMVSKVERSWNINEQLSNGECDELSGLLDRYVDCFAEELKDIGKCGIVELQISLTTEKPVVNKPYPIPFPKQKTVDRIVSELLELNIIRPSDSLYSSPIVLVRKQNGEDRLCIDYRALNAITEKQPWFMPTIEGVLSTLAGKKYFTTLDLVSGYYQVEINEASKQFTAFVTHSGHSEFNRMPFGLRNAPSTFQQMMTKLIAPMKDRAVSYVDEVIIASESFQEGLRNLEEFLCLVRKVGLTLRPTKCSFMVESVTFLGHELSAGGIRPGQAKIKAVENYPTPTNVTEVRRFLGLSGFFRKFVPGYAHIAHPITKLTRKESAFEWSQDCETSFRTLIRILISEPVLGIYSVERRHVVHTDASNMGLAAILLQEEEKGSLKPIAYFSRLCTNAEAKYHAYELEVLAVVEACQRFRQYLLGKHFTIETDCAAISSMKSTHKMIPRVARWFLKLMEYDYSIQHRAGRAMCHVDAMSRAPVYIDKPLEDVSAKIRMVKLTTDDWVAVMQKEDPKLKAIMDLLENPSHSTGKSCDSEFLKLKSRLYRKGKEEKPLLVVPRGMRWRIAKMSHDDCGHPGVDGSVKRVLQNFWFPRCRNFLKNYIKSCIECGYSRQPAQRECQLFGMNIPEIPFEVLHMDHLGPFVRSRKGNEYVLVVVDALTRYTVIVPTKSTKTKPVIDALCNLTLHFGMPKTVVSDRGSCFTSAPFAEFCEEHEVRHVKVAVRTPRANGLAERVNQTILSMLKASVVNAKNWDDELRRVQWTINTKINATTKYSPMDLIYDFPVRDITGNKILAAVGDAGNDNQKISIEARRDDAIHNIERAWKIWKARFDAKYKTPHAYKEGDLVLIESVIPSTGESRKLEVKFRGPYTISKVLRYDRYVVEDVSTSQRKQRRFSTIMSSDKLKPWCALYPDIDDDYDDDPEETCDPV